MLDARQEKILSAVIREYIQTAEPVGSQALVQKYDLGCSAATIRHEMSRLEDAGYLGHPHTSAGRVPMIRAYRFFVDRILSQKVPPPPEEATIRGQFTADSADVDDLLQHTSKLLANLTRHTALVLGPRLRKAYLKYLQLVPLTDRSLMMVLLTNTGQIVNRVVELEDAPGSEDIERLTRLLNERLRGLSLADVNSRLLQSVTRPQNATSNHDVDDKQRHELRSPVLDSVHRKVLAHVGEIMQQAALTRDSRVVWDGTANLCAMPEFRDGDKLRGMLELLEEEKTLAEVLGKTMIQPSPGVHVSLGSEIPLDMMHDCAMITATYHIGGEPVGSLGVLGPTRLPYERVIAVVGFVAECFSSKLWSLHSGTVRDAL